MSRAKWLISVLLLMLVVGVGLLATAWFGSLALATAPPTATATAIPAHAEAITRARSLLLPLLQEYPALSVSVAVEGAVVWSEALGWADVAQRRPASADSRFRLYSNSKPFTAVLALRLAARGLLDLDRPIGHVLPALPAPSQQITLRQLLGHLGGVRDYRKGEWMALAETHCIRPGQALDRFVGDRLLAAPGTHFQYASFGYVLASAVIEAATGQDFHTLLKTEVLDRAGMAHSGPETASDPLLVRPYQNALLGRVRPAPRVDNSCKFGAGALTGTSRDLVAFGLAVLDDRLLDAGQRAAMFSASAASAAAQQPYGLGIGLAEDDVLGLVAAHSGGAVGGRSYLLLAPDRGLVVALLGNLEGRSLGAAAWAVAQAFATASAAPAHR